MTVQTGIRNSLTDVCERFFNARNRYFFIYIIPIFSVCLKNHQHITTRNLDKLFGEEA
jgi:hypothetical protein